MKVVIIGSSIAGAAAALVLSKQAEVVVYEMSKKENIGEKLCANNVTKAFFDYAGKLVKNPERFVVSKCDKMKFFSQNNQLTMNTKEFIIDRKKLVNELIKKSEKNKVKFNFETSFVDFRKNNGKFIIVFERNNRKFVDACDVLIGADGALSKVAEKSGLWKNRKLLLAIQSEATGKIKLEKRCHYIYLKNGLGYYNWIIQNKKTTIGVVDNINSAKRSFGNFSRYLGLKAKKTRAALIPEPKIINSKNNLFLIGDAGCQVKFSGGGIVPSLIAAIALKKAVNGDFEEINRLNSKISLNSLLLRAVKRMRNKDWDNLIEILKNKKFSNILERRDELVKRDVIGLADLRLLKFLFKII
jgi:flavin-dependent dehydrogenase